MSSLDDQLFKLRMDDIYLCRYNCLSEASSKDVQTCVFLLSWSDSSVSVLVVSDCVSLDLLFVFAVSFTLISSRTVPTSLIKSINPNLNV